MDGHTPVHLAKPGCCDQTFGWLLTLMLNEANLSVGRETSLVGELRAQLAEVKTINTALIERCKIAETRESAAHERARLAEEKGAPSQQHTITDEQLVEAMLIAARAPSDPAVRDAMRGRMRNLARGGRACIDEDDRRAQDVARALGVKAEGESRTGESR